MPSNFTVDDYSPLIQYQGQWLDSFNSTLDPFTNRYRDSSFHSSMTNASTATLEFKGTAIYIFGAKRGNHGFYHVALDGNPGRQFDGFVTNDVFQYPLFVREGLADGLHTMTLTNVVSGPNRPYVDIDYIVWTQKRDVAFNSEIVDDPAFDYSTPTSDWSARTNADGYRANTAHSTTTYGAAASLTFYGSEFFLYGGTGPNHGQFKVQIDNQQAVTLNGTAPVSHTQTLLYTASGLEQGAHRFVITNLGDGQVLDVDYAEIIPTPSDNSISKGAIAGMVVGIVAGLTLLTLTLWFFFIYRRHKNKRRFSADLMSDDSQTAMAHPNGHRMMVVEPFVDQPENHGHERGGGVPPENMYINGNEGRDAEARTRTGNRKGGLALNVNRDRYPGEARLRPEPARGVTDIGPSSGVSTSTVVETDAGALPPMYDQIQPSRVVDLPVRN